MSETPQNPFAAPEADLNPPPQHADYEAPGFYTMSRTKLLVMSILTFGLYDLVWWWRQWKARVEVGYDYSPFWRTVFAPLMFFGFKKDVEAAQIRFDVPASGSLAAAPAIYLGSNVAVRMIDRVAPEPLASLFSVLVLVVCGVILFNTQGEIDKIMQRARAAPPTNVSVTAGSVLLGLLGALLWLATIAGMFGLLDEY